MVAKDRIELSTRGFSVCSVCLSMSFNVTNMQYITTIYNDIQRNKMSENVTKFTAQCDKIVPRIHIE
ncbi:MAG: hypothetical protein BMS9Abin18_0795 [Zetaproteobacteria bacterium]|nr:MAG: hypothetical protein BMS9Abin18_0795 [Zetaproteobacteria bacterium]